MPSSHHALFLLPILFLSLIIGTPLAPNSQTLNSLVDREPELESNSRVVSYQSWAPINDNGDDSVGQVGDVNNKDILAESDSPIGPFADARSPNTGVLLATTQKNSPTDGTVGQPDMLEVTTSDDLGQENIKNFYGLGGPSGPILIALGLDFDCPGDLVESCCADHSAEPGIDEPGSFGDCKDLRNQELKNYNCPDSHKACCKTPNRITRRFIKCRSVNFIDVPQTINNEEMCGVEKALKGEGEYISGC